MPDITLQVGDDQLTVDLSANVMTLREHARLQSQIGGRLYDRFARTGRIQLRPDFLSAYLWAKVATQRPDVRPDDIDVDFVELIETAFPSANGEEAEPPEDDPKA